MPLVIARFIVLAEHAIVDAFISDMLTELPFMSSRLDASHIHRVSLHTTFFLRNLDSFSRGQIVHNVLLLIIIRLQVLYFQGAFLLFLTLLLSLLLLECLDPLIHFIRRRIYTKKEVR